MDFKRHKTWTPAQADMLHRREKAGGDTCCHGGFKDTEEAAKETGMKSQDPGNEKSHTSRHNFPLLPQPIGMRMASHPPSPGRLEKWEA